MKPIRLSGTLSLAILLIGGTAIAQQPQPEYPEPGMFRIDWQRQTIIVNSVGSPAVNQPQPTWRATALRAAKLAAARDLLEAVKGIAITSTTTIENMMVSSDQIRSAIEGEVHNFIILDTRYYDSMDVGVIVEMPLTGALTEAVLGESVADRGRPEPGRAQTMTGSRVSTGLIIDASGLDVTPAMAPKILDEEGNEVYGTANVDRQWAITQGVVGYHNDINAAARNERVAGNPLIVRAIGVTGPNRCDVVISTADAARILELAANQPFLDEARVMFVLK